MAGGHGLLAAGLPPVLFKPLAFNLKKCQQAWQLQGWELLELVPACPTLSSSKIQITEQKEPGRFWEPGPGAAGAEAGSSPPTAGSLQEQLCQHLAPCSSI